MLPKPSTTIRPGNAVELMAAAGTLNEPAPVFLDNRLVELDDLLYAVLVVLWDATERMAQEKALREQEEQLRHGEAEAAALAAQMQALASDFQLLADEVPTAVFRCDGAGKVDFHNARWDELIGLRERALVALEALRRNKLIGSAQEARIRISTDRPERWQPDRDRAGAF